MDTTHPPATALSPLERARHVRRQLPPQGLFAGRQWRIATGAFPLLEGHVRLLERLGETLHRFTQACNLLYRHSLEGKEPGWIAELADRGKPADLLGHARHPRVKGQVAPVIRPDLVLLEDGFALTEIDSVPGGIGLTQWLNTTYAGLGEPVLGGADGMRAGFRRVFPEGDVVISEEAADYRPEMEYLVGAHHVKRAEDYACQPGTTLYRFFECFDWEALGGIRASYDPATVKMVPPLKPQLEEKLWLALFWNAHLQDFWRRHVSERGVKLLREVIPYSWVVDPAPLPPQAVLPRLEAPGWDALKDHGQKRRDWILKLSGFHENAWGARSVKVGSDLSTPDWADALDEALGSFRTHPYIMQEFKKGALFEQDYVDPEVDPDAAVTLRGRARVSPYYYVHEEKVTLGGVLVTLCPADKKLLHGMRDAVISPAKAA
ncbi:MAG: hypothetical protein AAGK14_02295 [Verrucomicrobiota bacterium]